MRSRRGFFASELSSLSQPLFSVSTVCWVCILAAFSLRISSRVFTRSSPTAVPSGPESGPAVLWFLPVALSAALLALLGLSSCPCCSSCLFFLARRTSENVLTSLMVFSLIVMPLLPPLVALLGMPLVMFGSRVTSESSFWS